MVCLVSIFANSQVLHCPYDNPDRGHAPLPPSFVGDNYFCDENDNGALWDAMDCVYSSCIFISPAYFTVTLPTPTSDAIEARVCRSNTASHEDTYITILQIFVK